MGKRELLMNEIEQIPENLIDELLDFTLFLKTKVIKEKVRTVIASEVIIKRDWLKAEEEKAWQNL